MKILCKNGNTVERWYDRQTRSSVTQVLDPAGNQLGSADYDGNKASAKFSLDARVEENGGAADKPKKFHKAEKEAFIINWLLTSGFPGIDATMADFHTAFWNKFGGSRKETNWGAKTVNGVSAILKRMESCGMLWRGRVGLGANWQPGFPRWVWGYSLTDSTKETWLKYHK